MKTMQPLKNNARKPAPKILGTVPLFAVCFFLILAGCQNPFQRQDAPETHAGTGTVLLTINGRNAARTIMPPETTFDNFTRFELVFTSSNGGEPKFVDWYAGDLTGGTGMVELYGGTWGLVVTAFMTENGGEIAAAKSGPDSIAVPNGGQVERDVVLLPIGGTGTFSWDIELLGSNIVTARMEILLYPGRGAFRGPYYLAGGDAPIGLAGYIADLDAGQYFAVFTLSNGERNVRATEILRVYAYRTSHFRDAFSDDVFAVSLLYTRATAFTPVKI